MLEDAKRLAETGQFDLALKVAQEIENTWERSKAFRDIAGASAKIGQFDRAFQIAK